MSRKRLIAPSFFTNADLYDAEVASGLPIRVAYAGLWTVTDRRGVFKWSRNLKPEVLPYDPCDIIACLDALERAGVVVSYEVGGRKYGWIPTFTAHQTFHNRERPSTDPAPPEHLRSTGPAQGQPQASVPSLEEESPVPAPVQPEASPKKAVPSPTVTVTGTVSVTGTGTGTASTAPTDAGTAPTSELPEGPGTRKPPNWVAEVGDRWVALVGDLGEDYSEIAGRLKHAHRVHGLPAVLAAVDNFAKHRSLAVVAGNADPDRLEQFARDLIDYIPANLKARGAA